MREAVEFKGTRYGIYLVLDQRASFSDIINQLKTKLDEAVHFFAGGTVVDVSEAMKALTPPQRGQLLGVLASYGLTSAECECTPPAEESLGNERQDDTVKHSVSANETLIVPRTVRSGQRVEHDGSIIVDGDVNPGAEIIAGGNIIVLGACRGLAHAGAHGDRTATITAERLVATQLRIAGIITRAPDEVVESNYTETARIADDNSIIIEPAILKEV